MQLAGGHWTFKYAFWFRWKVTRTIASDTSIKNTLEAWALCIPATSIIHYGSKLMLLEIASSQDGIFTYLIQVLISWDPGGSGPEHPDTATGIN